MNLFQMGRIIVINSWCYVWNTVRGIFSLSHSNDLDLWKHANCAKNSRMRDRKNLTKSRDLDISNIHSRSRSRECKNTRMSLTLCHIYLHMAIPYRLWIKYNCYLINYMEDIKVVLDIRISNTAVEYVKKWWQFQTVYNRISVFRLSFKLWCFCCFLT